MADYMLRRTGLPPIKFKGTLLVQRSSKDADSPVHGSGRMYTIRVYRHDDGRYVCQVLYGTTWAGEYDVDWAVYGESVARLLECYEPLRGVRGYPTGERFQAKQERLKASMRATWESLVSDVLGAIPDAAESV